MKVGGLGVRGLVPAEWDGHLAVPCADSRCTRKVATGDPCFLDMQSNHVYCDGCGKCLRYARKKAAERGEEGSDARVD